MNKKRKKIIQNNEISEIAIYSLAGHRQKILMEGKKATNPVVIFLHGGPGVPFPFCAGSRGMFPEFTDKFIMVYWDQLGCGINNCRLDKNFKINNFVNMTIDLVTKVKKKFPENQITLFGISWGSILAAKAAEKAPHLVDKVLIYGQVLKELAFNEETFGTLLNAKMSEKKKRQLKSMWEKEPKTIEDLEKVMGWIRKYTDGYLSKEGEKMSLSKLLLGILNSPDYTLKDARAAIINRSMRNRGLLTDLMNVNLTEELKNMQVPYRILQGDTDSVTSTMMVKSFVNNSKNSNLSAKIIERSGHIPSMEGMQQILKEADLFLEIK
ncbi:alpha/beta hydrolase [Enterococcus sp. BWB1-3]|nr:alpha/beta hydrolase [Enterococcus sp. BWB1-3]